MVILSTFQLLLIMLASDFSRQVRELARLTSELLETAFDATFFISSSDSMLVDTSSSGLDNVFCKGMQGCALDDTVIVNGVESAQRLCKLCKGPRGTRRSRR